MTRVLLVNPPQTYGEQSQDYNVYFPLGLMSLAARVRDICDIEILDCILTDEKTQYANSVRYGLAFETITNIIQDKQPDIVGITVPFTAQFENAERVGKICREVNTQIITVFGGPDPTVRFRQILEKDYCDYCVVGEGEETFYEFVKVFSKSGNSRSIPGLAYKHNGIIHYQQRPYLTNLDELPFPAFDLIDVNAYLNHKFLYRNRSNIHNKSISIITSRGCPYRCVFCSVKLHMGNRYRYHSPEYVLKLLQLCVERYGITNFHFEDDNISLSKERFEKILNYIIDSKLQINWDTPNGVRPDSLNYDTLVKMKASGCTRLVLAIESGSQRVLDEVIKKNTSLDYLVEIAVKCHDLDIHTRAFYVIGFPGEKIDEMKQTTDLALSLFRQYSVFPELFVATPLYGTDLYKICLEGGFIEGDPTFQELSSATQTYGNPMISTADFSKEDIKEIINEYRISLRKARIRYSIMHPLYTAKLLRERFLRHKLRR